MQKYDEKIKNVFLLHTFFGHKTDKHNFSVTKAMPSNQHNTLKVYTFLPKNLTLCKILQNQNNNLHLR